MYLNILNSVIFIYLNIVTFLGVFNGYLFYQLVGHFPQVYIDKTPNNTLFNILNDIFGYLIYPLYIPPLIFLICFGVLIFFNYNTKNYNWYKTLSITLIIFITLWIFDPTGYWTWFID